MLPATMRAVEVTGALGPSAVRIAEVALPEVRPNHVLLRVHAAGLNFADVMQTLGLYEGGPKPPYYAGFEAAGEVVAVGDGVDIQLGARLFGTGPRAFAEYVSWSAASVMPIPDGWSYEQAAAFPVQWLTAHACLRTCGRLRASESVLVHAAAGGVGQAAVRLAKHYGARVFATASSKEKLALARAAGADELIDYTSQDFVAEVRARTNGRGVDLVLEMVGGETFRKNLDAVVPFGRIVVFGVASTEVEKVSNRRLIFHPVELIGYHLGVMQQKRPDLFAAQLSEIGALIAQRVIVPEPPTTHALADAARALADLHARRSTGKLVLVP